MEQKQDLLVEIGTEELPPTSLSNLSKAFAEQFCKQLLEQDLAHGEAMAFCTPRRLAVVLRDVSVRQPDQENLRRGPAVAAAFDADGAPTKAASGFARSCGVEVDALERMETDKGAWLMHRQRISGQQTLTLLPQLITDALAQLPIRKRMRWGNGDEEFVRPLHWVCVRFGSDQVPGRILGVEISSGSRGHRFHHPRNVNVESPELYAKALRAAYVEPDIHVRKQRISEQVNELAASVQGQVSIPESLLDEVAALCEWPTALLGGFDQRFLQVPAEALIETMQKNQKYFPVFAPDGALLPFFITVANIESREPELVRAGNERVIRPRFADAMFFWEQDRKRPLADRQPALASVTFQQQLGSVWDKALRIAEVSRRIAEQLGHDPAQAERAALLCKCDLVTSMVTEFPSLQGIAGRYYAQQDGEAPCIVAAMEEQYLPRHAGDSLPASTCGRILSLADKLDTLIGIFAIGQRPTGIKDPYGLRRAAIAVLRMLIEIPLPLDLKVLLQDAALAYRGSINTEGSEDLVFAYIVERLPGYYSELGLSADLVDSVLVTGATVPCDIDRRIRAVAAFRELDAADALAAANKRTRNILKKASPEEGSTGVQNSRFLEPAEQRLAERIDVLRAQVQPLLAAEDYEAVLRTLAELREDVDSFFEQVMVMADEPELRDNRIAILRGLEQLFLSVADIALLQPRTPEGETKTATGKVQQHEF